MDLPGSPEQLLRKMVGFDSVNASISGRFGAEVPLAEFLESHARSLGLGTTRLQTDEASFNLLITHCVSGDAPWLLFVSHLDTVSTEHMTIDPFAGDVRDGCLYGRGACDTKGSGAAMLSALADYKGCDSLPNNVAILYSVDEEIGKTGVKAFAEEQMQTLDWTPAGVVVGEPTELRLVVAHNGVVRWKVRTKGVSAHSADPSQGRSAISDMVKVFQAIEQRYITRLSASHPLTGQAVCSINVIRGGTQVNIVPDSCEIEIDRRLVPGEDHTHVLPTVEQLLDELQSSDPDLKVSQDEPFVDPPLDPSGHEGFIAFLQHGLAAISLPNEPVGVGFGTEASTFSNVGIPAVVLGPGSIVQAHTSDEWISLDQLGRAKDLYLQLMQQPLENT